MTTGERIYRARTAAGMTRKELAAHLGMTEGAVRHYESGRNTPNDSAIERIADVLGVTPQSLRDKQLDSVQDVLEALFQMEEAGFGIEPAETKNGMVIAIDPDAPHAPKLQMALEKWDEQRKALKGGDVSKVEYALWRGSFGEELEDGELK